MLYFIKCIPNFFRKLSIVDKNAYNKKYVSWWCLQIMFGIFCEILHIGWDKRQKPWFSSGFHGFHNENRLVGNFHYYIRNQRIEIHKYGEFKENWRIVNSRQNSETSPFLFTRLFPILYACSKILSYKISLIPSQ